MADKPVSGRSVVEDAVTKSAASASMGVKRAGAAPEPEFTRAKDKKRKKRRGIVGKIIPLFILFLVMAMIVGVMYYNVFDIREKYLRSTIDKIPIISGLFPAQEASENDKFAEFSREDLIAMINDQDARLKEAAAASSDQDRKIEMYLQEISNLKVFEDQQTVFKEDKASFDAMLAAGDPDAYTKYFEQISPENAAELYSIALGSVFSTSERRKYFEKIAAMDETSAARALEELIPSDMPIVVDILKNLKSDQSAAILSEITAQMRAAVIKQMYP